MEYLHASLMIAGGIVIATYLALARKPGNEDRLDSLMIVQALTAIALYVLGLGLVIKGPLKPFDGPPLVQVALCGATYGAIAAAIALTIPQKVPKPAQMIFGIFCTGAGVILLLLQLHILSPR